MIRIWTDGSSKNGRGGWAYIIEHDGNTYIGSGKIQPSTINLAELEAIKQAFLKIKELDYDSVVLYTDSMYCIDVLSGRVEIKTYLTQVQEVIDAMDGVFYLLVHANGSDNHKKCHNLAKLRAKESLFRKELGDNPTIEIPLSLFNRVIGKIKDQRTRKELNEYKYRVQSNRNS